MREHWGSAHFAHVWRESAWLFRSLTENLGQCVYVLDREGRCLDANDGFCRWLKRPRSEILGRPIRDFWPQQVPEREASEHERVLGGEWIETEEERSRGQQTSRVRLRKAPLRDAEGNVRGVLCLFREAPAEPSGETFRQPQLSMELLGRMTSGVLHDLRNLLTLLSTPLTLLKESLPAGVGEVELETLWKAVQQGTAMSERLLRIARGDPEELRPLDVNASCAEVVDLLQHSRIPHVQLEARLRPGLPPVLAEPSEMMRVLLNLCQNACDAMPQGGQLLLETNLGIIPQHETTGSAGDSICVHVRDTGEGMTPEVCARIFEPMFTTKPAGRNSGLGLPIVRDIVQRWGGRIECQSARGAGTCFTVWLPACSAPRDPALVPSPQRRGPKSILVVESNTDLLLLAATILGQQGFRVFPLGEGRQAIELYRREQGEIDLVVVEENLPGKSGLEVTNELLALNPRLAIVLVSAAGTPAASCSACTSRLALLNKPYTPEQLVQCVRAALSQR